MSILRDNIPKEGLMSINTRLSASSAPMRSPDSINVGRTSAYFQAAGTALGLGFGGTILLICVHKGRRFIGGRDDINAASGDICTALCGVLEELDDFPLGFGLVSCGLSSSVETLPVRILTSLKMESIVEQEIKGTMRSYLEIESLGDLREIRMLIWWAGIIHEQPRLLRF